MTYNNENIFARIIKGEADCVKILENDYKSFFNNKNQ